MKEPIRLRFFIKTKSGDDEMERKVYNYKLNKMLNLVRANTAYYNGTFDMFDVNVDLAISKIELVFDSYSEFFSFMQTAGKVIDDFNDEILDSYDMNSFNIRN